MYKKVIEYVDFDGETKTFEAEFHVSPRDIEMLAGKKTADRSKLLLNAILEDIDSIQKAIETKSVSEENLTQIFNLVDNLARISYGQRVKRVDPISGKTMDSFVRDDESTEMFLQTEAWRQLSFNLVNTPEELTEFFSNVLPQQTLDAVNQKAKSLETEAKSLED